MTHSVLLVEDDGRMRRVLRMALEDEGHVVSEAADGHGGVALLASSHPDVVLLDLMLPGRRRLLRVPADPAHQRRADHHGDARARTATTWSPGWRRAPTTTSPSRSSPRSSRHGSGPCCAGRARRRAGPAALCLAVDGLEIRVDEGNVLQDGVVAADPDRVPAAGGARRRAGKVCSREHLLDRVWGYGYFGDSRIVDVHVRRLRSRSRATPASPVRSSPRVASGTGWCPDGDGGRR